MANPSIVADSVAQNEWAGQKRAEGAIVTVQGHNGRYFHADTGFGELIGRQTIAENGFDMIPAERAKEGASLMADNAAKDNVAWFPFKSDAGGLVWCKFETRWFEGLMACAIWKETDAAAQHVHFELL